MVSKWFLNELRIRIINTQISGTHVSHFCHHCLFFRGEKNNVLLFQHLSRTFMGCSTVWLVLASAETDETRRWRFYNFIWAWKGPKQNDRPFLASVQRGLRQKPPTHFIDINALSSSDREILSNTVLLKGVGETTTKASHTFCKIRQKEKLPRQNSCVSLGHETRLAIGFFFSRQQNTVI